MMMMLGRIAEEIEIIESKIYKKDDNYYSRFFYECEEKYFCIRIYKVSIYSSCSFEKKLAIKSMHLSSSHFWFILHPTPAFFQKIYWKIAGADKKPWHWAHLIEFEAFQKKNVVSALNI